MNQDNSDKMQGETPSLQLQLKHVIGNNIGKRLNGTNVSLSSADLFKQILMQSFEDLDKLNYELKEPQDLTEKHIEALAKYWKQENKTTSTILTRMAVLKIFSNWIGKKGLVKNLQSDFVGLH